MGNWAYQTYDGFTLNVLAACSVLVGLCLGSFLNVVIIRLPAWERFYQDLPSQTGPDDESRPDSLYAPSSLCRICRTPIRWFDNLPLLSFALLQGRCRHCAGRISWQYPCIELIAAGLTVAVVARFGVTLEAVWFLLFNLTLVALGFIDWREQQLPDSLTQPLLWFGLLASLLQTDLASTPAQAIVPLSSALWGAIVGFMTLWLVLQGFALITRRDGLGYGDLKLLAAIGAWVGVAKIPALLLLASSLGLIAVGIMVLTKRARLHDTFAFGSFLVVATLLIEWGHLSTLTPLLGQLIWTTGVRVHVGGLG